MAASRHSGRELEPMASEADKLRELYTERQGFGSKHPQNGRHRDSGLTCQDRTPEELCLIDHPQVESEPVIHVQQAAHF